MKERCAPSSKRILLSVLYEPTETLALAVFKRQALQFVTNEGWSNSSKGWHSVTCRSDLRRWPDIVGYGGGGKWLWIIRCRGQVVVWLVEQLQEGISWCDVFDCSVCIFYMKCIVTLVASQTVIT